jgi:hypothetical protein
MCHGVPRARSCVERNDRRCMQLLQVSCSFYACFSFFKTCLMYFRSLKDGLSTVVWIDVLCLDLSHNMDALYDAGQLRSAVARMDHVLMVNYWCILCVVMYFTRLIRYQRLGMTRWFSRGLQPCG